jgi:hypothetical protein
MGKNEAGQKYLQHRIVESKIKYHKNKILDKNEGRKI